MRERLQLANEMRDYIGKFYSVDYVRKNILKQNAREIEEIDNQEKYTVSPLSRVDVDFTDIEALTEKIKDISPNYIIHSAVSLDNFENNIRMFYALENVASLVEKIILIGSGAEYISARYKPLMNENFFPNEPVYPVDIYTLSKYTISKLLSISNA